MSDAEHHGLRLSLIIITLFAAAGTIIIARSFAGTSSISFKPSSNELVANDPDASQGTFISFASSLDSSRTCNNPVTITPPATDLASRVQQAAPGTCFYLPNGTYRIRDVTTKDNMIFEGESVEGVILDGNGFENAFQGSSSGVTIRNMQFKNFNSLAGQYRQEQSPIRGKTAIWSLIHASDWLVENVWSYGGAASGVLAGDNFTVRDSRFYNNAVTGIHSAYIKKGGLYENNEVFNNGDGGASGAGQNNAGMKIVWADGSQKNLVIRGNTVYNNKAGGIWCDLDCRGVIIEDNLVYDHGLFGIFYELSVDAVIRNNTVRNSIGYQNWTGDFYNGCIAVGESRNVTIENNTIEDCASALTIRQTKRPVASEAGYLNGRIAAGELTLAHFTTGNITIRNNTIRNSQSVGFNVGPGGPGAVNQSTLRFIDNNYDNPDNMAFWWNQQQQNYAQWQAESRQ